MAEAAAYFIEVMLPGGTNTTTISTEFSTADYRTVIRRILEIRCSRRRAIVLAIQAKTFLRSRSNIPIQKWGPQLKHPHVDSAASIPILPTKEDFGRNPILNAPDQSIATPPQPNCARSQHREADHELNQFSNQESNSKTGGALPTRRSCNYTPPPGWQMGAQIGRAHV